MNGELGDFEDTPTRSEPADFGGGESSGVQDLLNGETGDMEDNDTNETVADEAQAKDDVQTNHNITESADKIRVQTKVKRGTGTRDQDEINVKVKGDQPQEVVDKLNETIALLQDTTTDLRQMQADESDE